ncbi:PhyH-domain-containing protein [Aspergillus sclerotiicarbonarius CBS 121057]|uniref:PhyH-domain-containing protein n=1 Tax=Aspergillus sclerotiicarbonarius (strain CBS 121057 / IBT 28362) TaxID=1448318 RepID=A0A319F8A9_ASPSB|nr:PhyH-domain-containing protein [Aspergillus sclerotiicarbonarius CBS 121057]
MSHLTIPQTALPNDTKTLHEVTTTTPLDEVFSAWHKDGAIIIKNLLSPEHTTQLTHELSPLLSAVPPGSLSPDHRMQAFHGRQTKRAGNITNHSATFRAHLLDNDFLHAICTRTFSEDNQAGDYWLGTAATINVGAHQAPQTVHRDLGSYPPYKKLGPAGTEAQINFLIATTDFTEANGATRIIPGSNKWEFTQRGSPEQTIPAVMNAGDCLLISGKVVHGTGRNSTDFERGCLAMTVCASFLTPEEAHPFIVDMETARGLSERAQRFLGFRSQWPRGSPGLWTKDYSELALYLGLDA